MPRLSKREKQEWGFFIGRDGKRQYNSLCKRCVHDCKQSFRSLVILCRKYEAKKKT